ncbi:MAG TPA: pantoate--beta-alanine ligase [Tahibacter sp.]|uniref:pantoate--beta-alanine ligase n=1 Tax=Tahibacter sp. TaxID=2056211 RepID=UPI002BBC6D73|nr:pantoate--beta-alanine ligase [Tahibacter sp.]HSX61214.1 pantoate--beta-alanine ligase [Tahibacter sp.]
MDRIHSAAELRATTARWRSEGLRVALVPTMGNLHAGHYSLIRAARERSDRVVASVFVNPTQFGPNEDFARYPRTLDDDARGLQAEGCDLLFAPAVETMYPFGLEVATRVDVKGVTETLEGAFRPGHFAGVATVVLRLLNLVQPDVALFGRKDYQQLLTIRRLVADLCLPIEIADVATMREPDGLAMSSRNQYLSAQERPQAAQVYATLCRMRDAVLGGDAASAIERDARDALESAGFRVDYAAIRRAVDLTDPVPGERSGLVALIAARLGATRLIDNLAIGG